MIRFRCEHCGRSVRVSEKHAGKRGPCPACGKMLTIPSGQHDAGGALAELAAAVEGRRPAPPPPQEPEEEQDLDDFQPPDLQVSSARETDIFPAIGVETAQGPGEPPRVHPRPESPEVPVPQTAVPEQHISGRQVALIALIAIGVLGGAALIIWLALR